MPFTERLPPSNPEAERALLGSCLLDSGAIGRLVGLVEPRDFYLAPHSIVFGAMAALAASDVPLDFLTLLDTLESSQQLEAAGGVGFLSALLNEVPSPVHAEQYARMVAAAAVSRRLISAGGKIAALGFANEGSPSEQLGQAEQLLSGVMGRGQTEAFVPWLPILQGYLANLAALAAPGASGRGFGLLTGFLDLDRKTNGGLQAGNLVLLAGRPSMGKTALALSIATNIALSLGAPVGLFSLEMSKYEIAARIVSAEGEVDASRLKRGNLTEQEERRLGRALAALAGMPLYIDDAGAQSVVSIRSRARRLSAACPLSLLVVDHIQLVSAGTRQENRVQEMAEVSRQLKALATELGVPVLALSQLSRAVESRPDKHPQLADLRDSGGLEQDADLVILIYRDDYYHKDSSEAGTIELAIAKHRNGPTGDLKLQFNLATGRFHDLDLTPRPSYVPR